MSCYFTFYDKISTWYTNSYLVSLSFIPCCYYFTWCRTEQFKWLDIYPNYWQMPSPYRLPGFCLLSTDRYLPRYLHSSIHVPVGSFHWICLLLSCLKVQVLLRAACWIVFFRHFCLAHKLLFLSYWGVHTLILEASPTQLLKEIQFYQ